eukprot:71817-Prorocentrum_minimum.AAC.1
MQGLKGLLYQPKSLVRYSLARPLSTRTSYPLGYGTALTSLKHVSYFYFGSHLADLVGGLEAEEVEVTEQVVVRGEELQVELRQRQHGLPRVVNGGHHVLVEEHRLRRVQRERVDRLPLRRSLLERARQHLREEGGRDAGRERFSHNSRLYI